MKHLVNHAYHKFQWHILSGQREQVKLTWIWCQYSSLSFYIHFSHIRRARIILKVENFRSRTSEYKLRFFVCWIWLWHWWTFYLHQSRITFDMQKEIKFDDGLIAFYYTLLMSVDENQFYRRFWYSWDSISFIQYWSTNLCSSFEQINLNE